MRSLSEIETAVKRASRAVGYSWGNSEEVGKSIRQLELFGFQGIKNLNKYYKDKSTKKFEDLNFVYVGDGNNIATKVKDFTKVFWPVPPFPPNFNVGLRSHGQKNEIHDGRHANETKRKRDQH